MGSRLNSSPDRLFECYCEVVCAAPSDPAAVASAWLLMKYPDEFEDANAIRDIPKFCYPCAMDSSSISGGSQSAVELFTFTFTDANANFRFGFCRRNTDGTQCMCIFSVLPWHEFFYGLLNYLAELLARKHGDADFLGFLKTAYAFPLVDITGGTDDPVEIVYKPRLVEFRSKPNVISFPHAPILRLPQSRILTEYVGALEPDVMINIFAALLQERRVLMHSARLTKLTACVYAASALLYPMQWQWCFIPLLPQQLLNYVELMTPYLIGVPTQLLRSQKCIDLSDSVIVDIDAGTFKSPYAEEDLKDIPHAVVSMLRNGLKNHADDNVHKTFMRALVQLIGGYRNGLKIKEGEQIKYDHEAFVQSRPVQWQAFTKKLWTTQIFRQFTDERLDILNGRRGLNDVFEQEVTAMLDAEDNSSSLIGSRGGNFSQQYLHWAARSSSSAASQLRDVTDKMRDKSKKAFNNFEHIVRDISGQLASDITSAASLKPPEQPFKHHKHARRAPVGGKSHRAHSTSTHAPEQPGSDAESVKKKPGFEDNFLTTLGGEKKKNDKQPPRRRNMQTYRRPPHTQLSVSEPLRSDELPVSSTTSHASLRRTAPKSAAADRYSSASNNNDNSSSTSSSSSTCADALFNSGVVFSASQAVADAKLSSDIAATSLLGSAPNANNNISTPEPFYDAVDSPSPIETLPAAGQVFQTSSVDALLFDLDPVPIDATTTSLQDITTSSSCDKKQFFSSSPDKSVLLPKPPLPVRQKINTPLTPSRRVVGDSNAHASSVQQNRRQQTAASFVVTRGGGGGGKIAVDNNNLSSSDVACDNNNNTSQQQQQHASSSVASSGSKHPGVTAATAALFVSDTSGFNNNSASNSKATTTSALVSLATPDIISSTSTLSAFNTHSAALNSSNHTNNFLKTKTRASSVQPAANSIDERRLDIFVPNHLTATNSSSGNSKLDAVASPFAARRVFLPSSSASVDKMPVQHNYQQQMLAPTMLRPQPLLSPTSTGAVSGSQQFTSAKNANNTTGISSKTSRNAFDSVIGELVGKVGLSKPPAAAEQQQQQRAPMGENAMKTKSSADFMQINAGHVSPSPFMLNNMRSGPTSPFFGASMQPQSQFIYTQNNNNTMPFVACNPAVMHATNANNGFHAINSVLTGDTVPKNDDVYDMLSNFTSGNNNKGNNFQTNNNNSVIIHPANDEALLAADDAEELDIMLGLKSPKPKQISQPPAQQQQVAPNTNNNVSVNRPSSRTTNGGGGASTAKIAPPVSATQQRLEAAAAKKQQLMRTNLPAVTGEKQRQQQPTALTLPMATAVTNASVSSVANDKDNAASGIVPTHWEKFDS